MDLGLSYAHHRLDQWARWSNDSPSAWPGMTVLGRLIAEGPHGKSPAGPTVLPEAVANTDVCVSRLPKAEKRVVKKYYQRWEEDNGCARALRMKMGKFQRLLRAARWNVYHDLLQMETEKPLPLWKM